MSLCRVRPEPGTADPGTGDLFGDDLLYRKSRLPPPPNISGIAMPMKPFVACRQEQLTRNDPGGLPGLILRQDLLVDPRPDRRPELLVLVFEVASATFGHRKTWKVPPANRWDLPWRGLTV